MIQDLLLHLSSYPDPTPESAIDAARRLAERFDACLSVAVSQTDLTRLTRYVASGLVTGKELAAEENRRSRANTLLLLEQVEDRLANVQRGGQFLFETLPIAPSRELVTHARAYDLTIVPVDAHGEGDDVAQALLFGSGRPILLLPQTRTGDVGLKVQIGWDGSAAAARALGDALPLLARAETVMLVAVIGDKALDEGTGLETVAAHLERHGIAADIEHVEAEGRNAGAALLAHATDWGSDLLVMGGYGHSRAREFILGGATRRVLQDARMPVFLSH
ncbi:universal stress protein [Stakelama marina]|uniref:Universal stress protein n=1 Tax=Stakelama marina TaxID=2826939 RepID=A0A8T4I8H8_9SPHN|nr:universal stress protein [Stakelama marina]MBR0551288.1 universal stress protein [Stakelama marina]